MTQECELVAYEQESNHPVGRIVNVSSAEKIQDETDRLTLSVGTNYLRPASSSLSGDWKEDGQCLFRRKSIEVKI